MTRATNLTNFKYKIVPVALIRNFIIAIAINASVSQQQSECFFLKNSTKGFESFITIEFTSQEQKPVQSEIMHQVYNNYLTRDL